MGGLLAMVISGNLAEVSKNNPGFEKLLFALLFPVNLLLIILTGGLLFTGASFTTVAAVIEKKATFMGALKVLVVSWCGNLSGSLIFALFTEWCGLVDDSKAGAYAAKLTLKKCSMSFGQVFARGIGCNWLVCLAVYLSTMAQDLAGKYIAILLCISTFVAIGFEHIPANFYSLSMGYIANREFTEDTASPNVGDIFYKNFLPCTLGNFVAGAFCMAVQYSIAYGRLAAIWKPKNDANPEAKPTQEVEQAKEEQDNVVAGESANVDAPEPVKGSSHTKLDADKQSIILDSNAVVLVTTAFPRQVSHEGN